MKTKRIRFSHPSLTTGDSQMKTLPKLKTLPSQQVHALLFFAMAFLVFTPEVFGVANTTDAGLNTSTANLVGIVNGSLVPIVLISGCLAAAALSFMKSSPAPFIIAILTTISFGFARVWINTTYAMCA